MQGGLENAGWENDTPARIDTCRPMHAGRSGLVVSASDCGVRGPRFESHRRRLCLSR